MKIVVERRESDGDICEDMSIDGQHVLSVYPLCECPEDATIGRDLVSCSDVAEYMRLAFQAGANGEELRLDFRDIENED
jgi:hypothetical protein